MTGLFTPPVNDGGRAVTVRGSLALACPALFTAVFDSNVLCCLMGYVGVASMTRVRLNERVATEKGARCMKGILKLQILQYETPNAQDIQSRRLL